MKNYIIHFLCLNSWLIILVIFFLNSCRNDSWIVPKEYVGQWKTEKTEITVRTKPTFATFQFTSDSAMITININEDKSASGFIGTAGFENGKLKKNSGNPAKTGVAFIIECASVGKIFNNDPMETKEVEIWLGPIKDNGSIEAELRYTEGLSDFPMSGMIFFKED
jgi:hypothetical protein